MVRFKNEGSKSLAGNHHSAEVYPIMNQKAFQDFYPDELSHCYGCGRLNKDGLQIKSYWDGEETVAVFKPRAYHMVLPTMFTEV